MFKITIKIEHAKDDILEENVTFESEDINELKLELKAHIENSFENASHLLKKGLYPKKEIDMSLSIVSNNFFKSEKAINTFLSFNKTYIDNLKTRKTSHPFFSKNDNDVDEEELIPSYTNYIEREKAHNKIRLQFKIWTEEQDLYEKLNKKKETNKASSPKLN